MTGPGEEPRRLVVGADSAGQRLDRFLADRCADLSRSRIQAALDAGRVEVDGRARLKSHRLKGGETVVLVPLPRPELAAVPQDIPLNVVHEDADLAVVDKPAGMVVHPAPGHPDGTLVNALVHRYGALPTGDRGARDGAAGTAEPRLGGVDAAADDADPDGDAAAADAALRPGIVHRLDRDTSGLLVVALSGRAHAALARQLAERTLGRRYLALSWGRWSEAEGVLEGDIGRHPRDRKRMAVVARRGRPARTRYRVREDLGFCQLCEVTLETGRTHQIRVHFRHHGHPVAGDPVYGDPRRFRAVPPEKRSLAGWLERRLARQFLHAAELSLSHPASGERLVFTSPLPGDLAPVLARLRARA